MVGVIDGMRWCVLDGADVDPRAIAFSVVVCIVALFFGFRYFRQTEATFADQI
jgi:ABC-type polysaccharide/polyol phosphate export permease